MSQTTNKKEDGVEKKATEPMAHAADQQGGGNVDKIRDILFGQQIKTYEARFARVEEVLLRETSELKENTRKRFDSLEAYFKKETESLSARLKAEREERAEQLRTLALQLKESSEALSKRITNLQDETASSDSGLRAELMEESKKLLDEIRARHQDLSALMEKRVQELRNDKTDRSALAALLTEMAIRLNDDLPQEAFQKQAGE